MSGAVTTPMINHAVLPRQPTSPGLCRRGDERTRSRDTANCFPAGCDCIQRTTGPVHMSTARSTQFRRGSSVARTFQRSRRRYRSTLNRGVIAMLTRPFDKRGLKFFAASLTVAALAAAAGAPALASSHREAPFIASMPQVDATDFYMFRSYEPGRDGYVTLIANYLPLQDPYGGPNYFKLDSKALYEIHIVNDGGAVENLTFQFQFQNTLDDNQLTVGGKKVSIPLVQNGSADVATPASPALNTHETFTLSVMRGPGPQKKPLPVTNLSTGGTTFDKPVDYIGDKT